MRTLDTSFPARLCGEVKAVKAFWRRFVRDLRKTVSWEEALRGVEMRDVRDSDEMFVETYTDASRRRPDQEFQLFVVTDSLADPPFSYIDPPGAVIPPGQLIPGDDRSHLRFFIEGCRRFWFCASILSDWSQPLPRFNADELSCLADICVRFVPELTSISHRFAVTTPSYYENGDIWPSRTCGASKLWRRWSWLIRMSHKSHFERRSIDGERFIEILEGLDKDLRFLDKIEARALDPSLVIPHVAYFVEQGVLVRSGEGYNLTSKTPPE